MKILGVHPGWQPKTELSGYGFAQHDAAAALIVGGCIECAVEDERLNRIKHSNFFPVDAIQWILDRSHTSLHTLDGVAINISRAAMDVLEIGGQCGPRALGNLFRHCFGVDVTEKLLFCHHHLAHAASAYYPSGFDNAAVVSLDGDGEGLSGLVLHAQDGSFQPILAYPSDISLGNFYTSAIEFLGYRRFDEYKVMGLAPYGDPKRLRDIFAEAHQLLPDGAYKLSAEALRASLHREGLVPAAVRKPSGLVEPIHQDFAAALQETLERLVCHVMTHAARATGEKSLCYAGGVAHNAVANGKILNSGLFERMFVQGAAHDAGGAIGAALWVSHQKLNTRPRPAPNLILGPDIGDDEAIRARLKDWLPAISFTRTMDVAIHAAQALSQARVIGWAQGRCEFGPRALGYRSILADPRPPRIREIVNSMVKKREAFRPFSPIVLESKASQYFELPATLARLADMNYVLPVRPEWRELLGAVTHVDGTARIQTVSPSEHPLLAHLLEIFEARTGFAALLNTSFNNNAEPIVTTIDDVLSCFLTTELQALALGNWWVEKAAPLADVVDRWKPLLRADQELVIDSCPGSHDQPLIQSKASEYFVTRRHPVSWAMFEILRRGGIALGAMLSGQELREICHEAISLWSRRAITLSPHDPPQQ